MRSLLLPFMVALGVGQSCSDRIKPIELVFLQDTGAVNSDDVKQIVNVELPTLAFLLGRYPAESRFRVVTFRDKPILPYGDPAIPDYCIRYDFPFTNIFGDMFTAYSILKPAGGMDLPSNALGAILSVASSTNTHWSPPGSAPGGGNFTRVIAVITDYFSHVDTDQNPNHLPPHSGKEDDTDPMKCKLYWYPSVTQARSAIKSSGVYVVGLSLDTPLGLPMWRNFSSAVLGQSEAFFQPKAVNSAGFASALDTALQQVDAAECNGSTTTTTTTTATTTTTTTVNPSTLPPTTARAFPPDVPKECEAVFDELINYYYNQ